MDTRTNERINERASEPAGNPACRPAARMVGIRAYQPPADDPRVSLWLDANEGPALDPAVLEMIQRTEPESLRRYPNPSTLEAMLADRFGVDARRVVVTNGGDDAIDRLCRVMLEPGRTLVQHAPTFSMIEHSARLAGARVVGVPWMDSAFPAARFIDVLVPETGLAALVTPNNPTGQGIDTLDLLAVSEAAARLGIVVLIDLAYTEFADSDPTPALLNLANVVLVRTFSKAFGLAGLRVGYAIASGEVSEWMRAAGGPYPVSSISLGVAGAMLDRRDERQRAIDRVRSERDRLVSVLREIGASPLPSQANFVLARFDDAGGVRAALLERGISVRAFPPGGTIGDYLRITLPGDAASFDRLVNALRNGVATPNATTGAHA